MAIWATNSKRGLVPGTVGITITVIEYNAGTSTFQTVSSAAYRPTGIPLPTATYRRLESVPVSPVRPFVLAALTERRPYRGTRHSPICDGDES